jgi:hypothetical protein
MECLDFQISSNNRFIACAGKEGVVKVYDYFMRGEVIASTQAFLGHFKYPKRVVLTKDLRCVYSVGELNGIYKWAFYGDASSPEDISQHFEELQSDKDARAQMTEEEKEQGRVNEGLFGQDELASYTQQQLDKFNGNL